MRPDDAARGWVEIEELLTAEECARIVDDCERLCADPADRHPRDKPSAGTRHLEALDARSATVAALVERRALVDVVDAWFGRSAPPPAQVSWRAPDPGFGEQDLHRDAIEGAPAEPPGVVTAIVALVDVDESNGATRIVPGSHRTGQSAAPFRGRGRSGDEVLLTGSAGTAFVFNGHVLHAGGANRSGSPRHALQIVWRLDGPMTGGAAGSPFSG